MKNNPNYEVSIWFIKRKIHHWVPSDIASTPSHNVKLNLFSCKLHKDKEHIINFVSNFVSKPGFIVKINVLGSHLCCSRHNSNIITCIKHSPGAWVRYWFLYKEVPALPMHSAHQATLVFDTIFISWSCSCSIWYFFYF